MAISGITAEVQQAEDELLASETLLLPRQAHGVEALIVISVFSLIAVVSLLTVMIHAAFNALRTRSGFFVRSHVAVYFVSLLLTDLLQAIGSIMNAKWIRKMSVDLGGFCTAQGAIKHAADVGTAVWVSVIAIHTFNVLFIGLQVKRYVMYIALIGGWCFIAAVVSAGPLAIQTPERGPFFGLSGYWCWIADGYGVERVVLDYMLMYMSAVLSFVMYSLVFLRLRGNIVFYPGSRPQFRSVSKSDAWVVHSWQDSSETQAHVVSVAKHMLLYPVAYTILILPIGAVRFAEWSGHDVPLGPVIFSDCVFLLSGLVNATLFVVTRRVIPGVDIRACLRRKSTTTPSMQRSHSVASTMIGSMMSKEDDKTFKERKSEGSVTAKDNVIIAPCEDRSSKVITRLISERRDSDSPSETSTLVSLERPVSEDAPDSVASPELSVPAEQVSHSFANFEFPSRDSKPQGSRPSSPVPLPPMPPPPPCLTIYTPASSSPVWPGLHPHKSEFDDVPRTARPFSYI